LEVDRVAPGIHSTKPAIVNICQTAVAVFSVLTRAVRLFWIPILLCAIIAFVSSEGHIHGTVHCHAHSIHVVACNARILANIVSEDCAGGVRRISSPEGKDVITGVFNMAIFDKGVLHVPMVIDPIRPREHGDNICRLHILC